MISCYRFFICDVLCGLNPTVSHKWFRLYIPATLMLLPSNARAKSIAMVTLVRAILSLSSVKSKLAIS